MKELLELDDHEGRLWVSGVNLLLLAGYTRHDRCRGMIERLRDGEFTPAFVAHGIRNQWSLDASGDAYADYALDVVAVDALADSLVGRHSVNRRRYLREVAEFMRAEKKPIVALAAPLSQALAVSGPSAPMIQPATKPTSAAAAKLIRAATKLFERWETTPAHEQAWMAAILGLDDVPVDVVRPSFTSGSLAEEHACMACVVGKLLKAHLDVPPGMMWLVPTQTPIRAGVYRMVDVKHYDWSLKDAADAILIAHKIH